MRLVVTGGGTGGHVTPIRYVVAAYRSKIPEAYITYIGQKGDRFSTMLSDSEVDQKYFIRAGKWRRYPQPLWKTLIDVPTLLKNIRDAFYVLIGTIQSVYRLRKLKPDVIFVKGGYVGVPVGLAASMLGIPLITHDSDVIPGLANKIISKWAKFNAVGSRFGEYPYSQEKIRFTGVPIDSRFSKKITDKDINKAKEKVGAGDNPVILVAGGSLGARTINNAVVSIAPGLMRQDIEVFHLTGENNSHDVATALAGDMKEHLYHIQGLVDDRDQMRALYLAADLVVARAGATTIAELASLKKPTIIIPAQQLSDQLKNGKILDESRAAVVLGDEEIAENPDRLSEAIDLILKDSELRQSLSTKLGELAHPDASSEITDLLLEAARQG